MLFQSFSFIFLFLPTSLFTYFFIRKRFGSNWGLGILSLFSLIFYGILAFNYLALFILSILLNFIFSLIIFKIPENSKKIRYSSLVIAVFSNILLLIYFKWGSRSYELLINGGLSEIVIPLGISFFTLKQTAYLVDVYEGLIKRPTFLSYFNFVCFFPQLVAGPIVHHHQLSHQFEDENKSTIQIDNIVKGIVLFSIGVIKKVILADNLGVISELGFKLPINKAFFEIAPSVLANAFQLYFDFSGYSDMAIGIALLFNISLPVNFEGPLRATSLIDFWKRWHITLTTFFRTYLFNAVIKKFNSVNSTIVAATQFFTMLLIGIWHKINLPFFLWGSIQGIGLILNHKARAKFNNFPSWLGWALTVLFFILSATLIRVQNLGEFWAILKSLTFSNGLFRSSTQFHGGMLSYINQKIFLSPSLTDLINGNLKYLILSFMVVIFPLNSNDIIRKFKFTKGYLLFGTLVTTLAFFCLGQEKDFIYFNF